MNKIIVVNKAAGMTSHDVVNRIRKIFNTKKVGHTGTLDPLATGVLVICVGKATKLVELLTDHDKTYIADLTCANSEHADWLLNGQTWWTRSAFYQGNIIWLVKDTGLIYMGNGSSNDATIRPVITISKSAISS